MNCRERQRAMGAIQLGCDVVGGTAALAQRNHALVAEQVFSVLDSVGGIRGPSRLVRSVHDGFAGLVYGSIRGLSTEVRTITAQVADRVPAGADSVGAPANRCPTSTLDAVEGVLNGLYGDYLASRDNGLATPISLRADGARLPLARSALREVYPAATPRVCLFIHGLACTESIWRPSNSQQDGEEVYFGPALAIDSGFTPLYVRYNSGLSIADNGRQLAALLTGLLSAYPAPIEELVLIGHSMGGLVARSAVCQGMVEEISWLPVLSTVISLGTPHCGAPLARTVAGVSAVLARIRTPGTQIPAEILDLRSQGIRDLGRGCANDDSRDEEQRSNDGEQQHGHTLESTRVHSRSTSLPPGVADYAVASTVTADPRHPIGVLVGDLLVSPASAAGRCRADQARINFTAVTLGGLHHFRLTTDPAIYTFIRSTLASDGSDMRGSTD